MSRAHCLIRSPLGRAFVRDTQCYLCTPERYAYLFEDAVLKARKTIRNDKHFHLLYLKFIFKLANHIILFLDLQLVYGVERCSVLNIIVNRINETVTFQCEVNELHPISFPIKVGYLEFFIQLVNRLVFLLDLQLIHGIERCSHII